MTDIIKDYWAIIVAAGTGLVWLVRLEAKGISNEREIKRLWAQRKEDLEAAKESRQDQKDALLRVETKLDDVKDLIVQISANR